MDGLEFIQGSELPIIVGATIWYLRHPIKELLRDLRLKRFKGFGMDAELEPSLQRAEAFINLDPQATAKPKAPQIALSKSSEGGATLGMDGGQKPQTEAEGAYEIETGLEFTGLRYLYAQGIGRAALGEPEDGPPPFARIIAVFGQIESAIYAVWRLQHGSTPPAPRFASQAARDIGLDEALTAAFAELRVLRDRAVHGHLYTISDRDVLRFARIGEAIVSSILGLAENKTGDVTPAGIAAGKPEQRDVG